MKGRLWKRALSLLLVVVLLVTALPLQAFASIQELLGNSAQENQAILDELASITGSEEDAQRYYQLMRQYNLLDEDGHTVEDWSVTMDGEEVSIAEIRQVLEGDYDPQQYVWVDGTPVTLENLDVMLQIEDYIAYLSETYFSQQEWNEEQLASLESLQKQVQESGIQILAADDGETIIGSGGMSHSARVTVTPTPTVQDGTATFSVNLSGAAEGQEVSFDWSAYGAGGLADAEGTVELTAGEGGTASGSFAVTLNDVSRTVFTAGGMKYYVNVSNVTNALFSANDGTNGTAEAMTFVCDAVQDGTIPEEYKSELLNGTTPISTIDWGQHKSDGSAQQEITLTDAQRYAISYGLVDTIKMRGDNFRNNSTKWFYDVQAEQVAGGKVMFTELGPLSLQNSPIADTVDTVDGVPQEMNLWELFYRQSANVISDPGFSGYDYAGVRMAQLSLYIDGQEVAKKEFGAQGAKHVIEQTASEVYAHHAAEQYDESRQEAGPGQPAKPPTDPNPDYYRVGPIYTEGDTDENISMEFPLSASMKEKLREGTLAISTPLYQASVRLGRVYFGLDDLQQLVSGATTNTEYPIEGLDGVTYKLLTGWGTGQTQLIGTYNEMTNYYLVHQVVKRVPGFTEEQEAQQYKVESHPATVQAINTNAPTVDPEDVTAPEGTYYPGQIVPVTVTFDEPVDLSTVTVVVNDQKLTPDSTGYSNVATVAYTVPPSYGTTVNVSSIIASDTAGNPMEAYNPGGETSAAGKELAGVEMQPLPSTAVEGMSAQLGGSLSDPVAQLSVQLSANEDDVQWLNGHRETDNSFDTDGIALRQVDGDGTLIPLKIASAETPLAGATLTAEWSIAPNTDPEEKTTTFELVLNSKTVLGRAATVTQKGFTPIKEGEWIGYIRINVSEDNQRPYEFGPEPPYAIYMQDNPYIEIYGYTEDGEYSYPYGGIEGGIATTFKMNAQGTGYLTDEDGKMIPESEEADFGVYLTDPQVAQLELTEDSRKVKLIPLAKGQTGVKVVALNAGLAKWVEADAPYFVKGGSEYVLRFDGGLTPLLTMPEKMSVPAYQDATIYWSSNLHDKDENVKYQITVSEAGSSSSIFSTTAPSEKNPLPSRCTIPADKLEPGKTYTVKVSGSYISENAATAYLYATTELTVEKANVTVSLAGLESYYITDDVGSQTFRWHITSEEGDLNLSSLPFSFTVTNDQGEVVKEVTDASADGSSATIDIPKVQLTDDPNSYRDVYTVTAQVTNGGEGDAATSVSYDSFLLYVYSEEALDIVVQDADGNQTPAGDNLSLNNNTLAPGSDEDNAEYRDRILALKRDIHLKEVISVNYGQYAWNEVADQIRWNSSDSSVASIDYKQGAVYENIENFKTNVTYRPTSDFLLAGHTDGTTTITATHNLLQDLSTRVEVDVETLKDKLYLFQCYPQGETTLTFEEYTDERKNDTRPVTITSNEEGAAAYYAEYGIASNVTCSYKDADGNQYYGTFYQSTLESGEPDAARMGLYPCNTMELRRAAYADLYIKNPDGTPYTGSITLRGGVYVGDKYQEKATFRLNTEDVGSSKPNDQEKGLPVTLDKDGRLQVVMDITEWETETGDPVSAGDPISYVFQIEKADDTEYYPLLVSIDATTNLENFVDRGESVIAFRQNPEEGEHPFVALQAVTYANYNALTNVLDSTGKVGPSDSLPVATLSTAVLWWGENENTVSAENASLRLVTENGIPVADVENTEYTVSNTAYPFSNLVTTQYNVTLDEDTMEGVLDRGETTGLQLEYYPDGESLSRRETLSFKLVNLLGVGKVEEAQSLSEMMTTMGDASGTNADAASSMSTEDSYVNTALNLVASDDGLNAGGLFSIQITPTSDPTKFLGFIQVGFGDLHADDSEGKGQVYANFNPGEDVQKSYAPGLAEMMFLTGQKTANQYMEGYQKDFDDAAAGKGSRDLEFTLGGYAESLIYYNENTRGWEVQILNGGFHAGGGMSYSWNFNTWCGPVPFTFSLTVGGSADISMDALSVAYYDQANNRNGLGTDFLTQLRIYLYVRFFAGVGFDYSVVAFKLGVYGEVSLDMRFRWLNRPYMHGNEDIINTADGEHSNNMDGQSFQVNGEIGLEFMVTVLFISYDKILFSYRFNLLNEVTNEWQQIDTYWTNNQEANQAVIDSMVKSGSLSVYSSGATPSYSLNLAPTLQSKEYLEEGGRRWGEGISLFSLDDTNGLANLEQNTYPYADPIVTDDGNLLVYISDMGESDQELTRVAFATKSGGGSYQKGNGEDGTNAIPSGTAGDGYGDSQAALAGTGDFAVAAWTRQTATILKDKTEDNYDDETGKFILSDDDQRMMLNSADVFASVYAGGSWTTVNLSTDNPGSPDLAPVVATNGKNGADARAIVAWRQVIVDEGTAGEDSNAQYANVTDFSQKDTIVYKVYSNGEWSEEKQVLYNGTSGTVKGLQAAMLSDGTAAVTYTLDTDTESQTTDDQEIAYTVIDKDGNVATSVRATSNNDLDENPQITTAMIGDEERFILGWYTEKKTDTTVSTQDGEGTESKETESDIRLLEFDANGVAGKRLPDSLSQAADEDVRVTSSFQFAKNVENIEDLSILWVEREESQEDSEEGETPEGTTQPGTQTPPYEDADFSDIKVEEWDVLKGVRLYANKGAYRFTGSMDLADMSEANIGTLIDSFDVYVSNQENNEVKAVILGTTYGENGETVTETARTVNDELVQYTVPSKTSNMYTATGSYTDSIEVLGLLVDYDAVQLGATVPIQFTVKNNGIHAVDTLTVELDETETVIGSESERLNLLPGQSTTVTVDYKVPAEKVEDVPYTITANFGSSGATGSAETGATKGLFGLFAKTGGETAKGTVYLDLPDLSITKAAIVKEDGGKRTIQIQLNNHSAAKLAAGEHEVQLRFYTDATCETPLGSDDVQYLTLNSTSAEGIALNGNTLTISGEDNLELINNGGFATQVIFEAGKFVQDKSENKQPQELPASGVNVFIQAVVLGEPAKEDEEAARSGDKVVQGEPRTTDNNGNVTAENLVVRTGEDVTLSSQIAANGDDTAVTVTVKNNLLTKEIKGNVTAVLLGKDGSILGSQQLNVGTGDPLAGEKAVTQMLTFAGTNLDQVGSVELAFTEAATTEEEETPNTELGSVKLNGAVLTETSEDGYTFQWGQDGSGVLLLVAKDPNATISCNGEEGKGSLPLNLTVGQTGTLTVTVTNGTDDEGKELSATYTIRLERKAGNTPSGGGGTTYPPAIPDVPHGSVSVNPAQPHQGDQVTITATPDEGYKVGEVTVTGPNGQQVTVTPSGDGKYTFTQPGGEVTIDVTFIPEEWPFEDVAEGDWFYDAVAYVYENGIMAGTSSTTFEPQSSVTRGQVVQMLYNLEGQPAVSGDDGFTDVQTKDWWYNAVVWASQNGVVSGYGDGTFLPKQNISRQEFAQMLFNYAKFKGYDLTAAGDLSKFLDGGDVAGWAETAMKWANGNEFINGHVNGTLEPKGTTTRGQAASILMTFHQRYVTR